MVGCDNRKIYKFIQPVNVWRGSGCSPHQESNKAVIPGLTFTKSIITNPGNPSSSIDIELIKVRSPIIRDRLFGVLDNPEAGRCDRLWFAGFLKSVGYSLEDICFIIDELTTWSNYDPKITWLQVRSVFRGTAQHAYFSTVLDGGSEAGGKPFTKGFPPCTVQFVNCCDCHDLVSGYGCKWVEGSRCR